MLRRLERVFRCCSVCETMEDYQEGYLMEGQTMCLLATLLGVTTSRATSGERSKNRNTGGQRGNEFNNSYRYILVVVAENNSVVKPKC